jgi:hypothetical protein
MAQISADWAENAADPRRVLPTAGVGCIFRLTADF